MVLGSPLLLGGLPAAQNVYHYNGTITAILDTCAYFYVSGGDYLGSDSRLWVYLR
jgi:hypothetical protein